MRKIIHIFSIVTILLLLLSACNMPQVQGNDPNAIMTITAQTIEAKLTQNALLTPSATLTPAASFTPTVTETPPPPSATNTPASSPTPTAICDMAEYVTDVTVADGTQFLPDEASTKTWRLKNIGVCPWTTGYQVIFDHGDSMSGPATQPLPGTVNPGQTVDLSLNLKAPHAEGSYRGYWKLRNPSGVLIPVVNGFQGNSFFVDIKTVLAPAPAPSATTGLLVPLIPLPPLILIPSPTPTLIPIKPFKPLIPIIPHP